MEPPTQLLVVASLVALLAACVYQLVWGAHSSQQRRPASRPASGHDAPRQQRSRELTLRVDEIPAGTSTTKVETDLQSIIGTNPELEGQLDDLVVRSLTPRDRTCACATVTLRTLLPEKQLLDSLQRASKELPYRYDCTFYGITPLYEDADGASCE